MIMIVYNITIKIDREIEDKWIEWQRNEHIPAVMATGSFFEYKFFRLLEQDETDSITYVIQYFATSIENYDRYIKTFAGELRKNAIDKWGDRFIAFRTIMELVQ